ncbi:YwqG family protein [Butyrivibrio proteoclasticus]|uniref:YwqG family protein n=1 Tax=Butyrivibrio proteoclasticus TaxID=43305 RepID=UPI000684947A|nr:YwqG family protein [Butyrivibrio proteoclasticus]
MNLSYFIHNVLLKPKKNIEDFAPVQGPNANANSNTPVAPAIPTVVDGKLSIARQDLNRLLDEIKKASLKKVIAIETHVKDNIALTDSKFGGYPYWPQGKEYPVNKDGNKLILLAQINLSDVEDALLPKSGLLQFFIDCDDLNGLDEELGHKVVYHNDIDPSVTEDSVKALGIRAASDLNPDDEEYFPLSDCYALSFEDYLEFTNFDDWRLWDIFCDKLKELYNINVKDIQDHRISGLYDFLQDDDYDYVNEVLNESSGHKMLGYPCFTQGDPRNPGEYDILLFQMDTDNMEDGINIMWGDSGVGNFFMNEEDLKNLDFDKAMYTWDCY